MQRQTKGRTKGDGAKEKINEADSVDSVAQLENVLTLQEDGAQGGGWEVFIR